MLTHSWKGHSRWDLARAKARPEPGIQPRHPLREAASHLFEPVPSYPKVCIGRTLDLGAGVKNWIQEFRWETQLSEARAEYLISAFSFFNVLLLCKSKDLWLELGDDTKA